MGCGLMEFDSLPLSDILDKMISTLKKSLKPKDREDARLIGRKLDRKTREIYNLDIQRRTYYVAIG